jgi:predicted 3-demethylubiquinone-9 3-methyltransferase (glyoxalase superfamily)
VRLGEERYGVSWQVVPGMLPKMLADPDREKTAHVMRAMMDMAKLDIAALQTARDGHAAA